MQCFFWLACMSVQCVLLSYIISQPISAPPMTQHSVSDSTTCIQNSKNKQQGLDMASYYLPKISEGLYLLCTQSRSCVNSMLILFSALPIISHRITWWAYLFKNDIFVLLNAIMTLSLMQRGVWPQASIHNILTFPQDALALAGRFTASHSEPCWPNGVPFYHPAALPLTLLHWLPVTVSLIAIVNRKNYFFSPHDFGNPFEKKKLTQQ